MEIPNDLDWSLIAKYLAGEATPAETELVLRWAASDPAHASELEALRGGQRPKSDTRAQTPHFDVDAAWAKTQVARDQQAREQREGARAVRARKSRAPRLSVDVPRSRARSRIIATVALLAA